MEKIPQSHKLRWTVSRTKVTSKALPCLEKGQKVFAAVDVTGKWLVWARGECAFTGNAACSNSLRV